MSLRGLPPKTEMLHKLAVASPEAPNTVASRWLPSGNQLVGLVLDPSDTGREWVSPVPMIRRNKPVRSANARYLPSGDITALRTGSSEGLAVRRCSVTLTAGLRRRAATQPAPVPIRRTARNAKILIKWRRADRAGTLPALVSRAVPFGLPATGAPKRWPLRARGSSKRGFSEESPKASGSRL